MRFLTICLAALFCSLAVTGCNILFPAGVQDVRDFGTAGTENDGPIKAGGTKLVELFREDGAGKRIDFSGADLPGTYVLEFEPHHPTAQIFVGALSAVNQKGGPLEPEFYFNGAGLPCERFLLPLDGGSGAGTVFVRVDSSVLKYTVFLVRFSRL